MLIKQLSVVGREGKILHWNFTSVSHKILSITGVLYSHLF